MKIIVGFIFGCMAQMPVWPVCAADFDRDNAPASPLSGEFFTSYSLAGNLQTHLPTLTRDQRHAVFATEHLGRSVRPIARRLRVSALALAIEGAAKKGFIERGIEMSAEALILCQKETSSALTTPFFRSDSQQAHCFRF
jgi:hypothetical protein